MLLRPHGGLGAVARLDLSQNALDVDLHGRFCETELTRDHFVGCALHEASQDLGFPVRQPPYKLDTRERRTFLSVQPAPMGLLFEQSQAYLSRKERLTVDNQLQSLDQAAPTHGWGAKPVQAGLEQTEDGVGLQMVGQNNHPG
nr:MULTISPECIES: hypothetical protein [unclassified Microvirga]